MIDIFKRSFRNAISNRLLGIEDLRTIAKEAEAIVNTRPLTYYTDDISYFPLRPIDFLRPHTRLNGPRPLEYDEHENEWIPQETTRDTLLEDWNRTSNLVSNFWKRWTHEYLTTLRENFRRSQETSISRTRCSTKGRLRHHTRSLPTTRTMENGRSNRILRRIQEIRGNTTAFEESHHTATQPDSQDRTSSS